MKRSILRRFALFSAIGFAAAICVSLLISLWVGYNDTVEYYHELANAIAVGTMENLHDHTYEEIFAPENTEVYEHVRTEMRSLCQLAEAEYAYLYTIDEETGVRTFLFCVAATDEQDERMRRERTFGAQSSTPLTDLERTTASGIRDTTEEYGNSQYGSFLTWYYPLKIEGSDATLVFGVDFDTAAEQKDILNTTIGFSVPLIIVITAIVLIEIAILKKSVSNPLRELAGRMRRFTQDGIQNQEHVEVGKTTEMADIATSFNQMTDDINTYVADIAKMSEERAAAQTELELARRIQLGLVPPVTHCAGDGFDAFAFERTARAVGGDFYDLKVLESGKVLCVIADVSGKGMSAALFMAIFFTLLRTSIQRCEDPALVLNELNDSVAENNPENMFVTLIAAVYEPETRTLTYANAGHTPPLVVGGSYLSPDPGIALGLFEDAGIVNETLVLEPGEGILLYTDGATEANNADKKFFGEEGLAQAVYDARDAKGAVHAAVEGVDSFVGDAEQFDDLTLLSLFAT